MFSKYSEVFNHLMKQSWDHEAFVLGFLTGQAEKVKLGACNACMIRPPKQHLGTVESMAVDVANQYGLSVNMVSTKLGDEIWISKDPVFLNALKHVAENSPYWHKVRGRACGIPDIKIVENWHEVKNDDSNSR